MIYGENITPIGLAACLAEYISDPSTIRVRVAEHFGKAPTVEQCRNLRLAVEGRRQKHICHSDSKFKVECRRHDGPYEMDPDGMDRCVQCKAEKLKAEQEKAEQAAAAKRRIEQYQARMERDRARRKAMAEAARRQKVLEAQRQSLEQLKAAEEKLASAGKPVLFSELITAVACAFKLTPDDILGDRRNRICIDARTALAKILKQRGSSYPMIARRMYRDHSTLVYLLKTYDDRVKRNPAIAAVVERLA